jgi:hypothetical protein
MNERLLLQAAAEPHDTFTHLEVWYVASIGLRNGGYEVKQGT